MAILRMGPSAGLLLYLIRAGCKSQPRSRSNPVARREVRSFAQQNDSELLSSENAELRRSRKSKRTYGNVFSLARRTRRECPSGADHCRRNLPAATLMA